MVLCSGLTSGYALRRVRAWLLLCAGALLAPMWAQGQVQSQAQGQGSALGALQSMAEAWLRQAAAQQAGAAALRTEVGVGALDSRLKLAPCDKVEAYLPPGARMWGSTRVGLRCVQGATRWNVTLPATVKAYGPAWVITGQVPVGAVVTDADVVESEVDWAEESAAVVRDRALWAGQVATRLLSTGQTLRQGMVKPAQVFQAGAQVRVVAQGPGFEVSGDALALSAGVVGQSARVRMENGRVASGVVVDTRTVRIDL
jgi:flagellar basal body P-ring formation protein FlgA